jgi:hypothetical protein
MLGLGACGGGSEVESTSESVVDTTIDTAIDAAIDTATGNATDVTTTTEPVQEATVTTTSIGESATADEPAISAEEVEALERDLDAIDDLIADIELELEQD